MCVRHCSAPPSGRRAAHETRATGQYKPRITGSQGEGQPRDRTVQLYREPRVPSSVVLATRFTRFPRSWIFDRRFRERTLSSHGRATRGAWPGVACVRRRACGVALGFKRSVLNDTHAVLYVCTQHSVAPLTVAPPRPSLYRNSTRSISEISMFDAYQQRSASRQEKPPPPIRRRARRPSGTTREYSHREAPPPRPLPQWPARASTAAAGAYRGEGRFSRSLGTEGGAS